jgi:endonuclease YncB( thermonuclease family)
VAERFAPEACEIQMWEDGDTPTALCGPGREKHVVRMLGIDTAESGFDDNSRRRGGYQVELWGMTLAQVFACGQAATRRVKELCPAGSPVDLIGGERDKYGRRLAYVICRGVNLNQKLVAEGLAGRYPFPGPPEKPAACPLP